MDRTHHPRPVASRGFWIVPTILIVVEFVVMCVAGVMGYRGTLPVDTANVVTTVAWGLILGSVATLIVDGVAIRQARVGKRWAVRHWTSTTVRTVTRTTLTLLGGTVLGAVLSGLSLLIGLAIPIVVVGFILKVMFGGGSSSDRPGYDPHPGYWKDGRGNTHSRTTPPPPGSGYR